MKVRNLGPFFVGATILSVGAVAMMGLLSMRKPPAQAGVAVDERSYAVNAILATGWT